MVSDLTLPFPSQSARNRSNKLLNTFAHEAVWLSLAFQLAAKIQAAVFESVLKMVRIQATHVDNRQDSAEALDFFSRGLIKAPFKTVDLKELPNICELMHQGKIAGRYVVKILE